MSLVGGVLALLFGGHDDRPAAEAAAATSASTRRVVETFHLRIRAWWLMCTVLAAAFLLGPASRVATVVLFGLISFWALREFITLTPTRPGDHRTLFWVFFLFTPLQYVLVGMGVQYYGSCSAS